MKEIRFDDVDGLKAEVSEEFSDFGPSIRITQAMVEQFADLTQDRQWIHVDPERCAKESAFGVPIAHGYFVLSLTTALVADIPDRRITGAGSVINYGGDKLRFVHPVPCGSELKARRRLAHVRKKGIGGTQLTSDVEIWVTKPDGESKLAVVYRSLALFMP